MKKRELKITNKIMKTKLQQKIYKITYGATDNDGDTRREELKNVDYLNYSSINVLAMDVYDALRKTEKHMLTKEKNWLKEDNMQLFVESVELLAMAEYVD